MSKLRFCANLKWLFTEQPFAERFAAAAEAGFMAVEYASPYAYSPAFLQQKLQENDLKQILINTPTGAPDSPLKAGAACHPGYQPAFRDAMHQALEYAEALSCPFIHLQAGIQPAGISPERALQQFEENIGWSVEKAEKQGVTLLLEAIDLRDIPGFFLHVYPLAAEIVRRINHPSLRLMLDLYHCQVMHGDISHNISRLLPLSDHIQIADAPTRSEPGSGELHWPFIFRQLEQQGYAGWIGCEYRPLRHTKESFSWLRHYQRRPVR